MIQNTYSVSPLIQACPKPGVHSPAFRPADPGDTSAAAQRASIILPTEEVCLPTVIAHPVLSSLLCIFVPSYELVIALRVFGYRLFSPAHPRQARDYRCFLHSIDFSFSPSRASWPSWLHRPARAANCRIFFRKYLISSHFFVSTLTNRSATPSREAARLLSVLATRSPVQSRETHRRTGRPLFQKTHQST